MEKKKNEVYEPWLGDAPISDLYPQAYNFVLINSIDMLQRVLSPNFNVIAFDTETTGLNIDNAEIVGFSFCYDGKNAYYVPVNHAPYTDDNRLEHNDSLGEEAIKVFYESLSKPKYILTFNQRFDIRVIERYGTYNDYSDNRYKHKYDMSIYFDKLIDVQSIVFLTDTNIPYPNLKGSEEKFLGWRGASFAETLGSVNTFYNLKPSECYIYAATDALGTYLLGQTLWSFYLEPESLTTYPKSRFPGMLNSAELDTKFLYPLMLMEDEFTNIDVDLMQEYSDWYKNELEKTKAELNKIRGKEFNPLSSKQKTEAFKDLGIVIYDFDGNIAYNKRGEMKASKELLLYNIEKLDSNNRNRIFLEDLIKIANLSKQKGTYADNFIKFCKDNPNGNKLRFGYKTMVVPSGRLAAGGDKKNSYFADSNIQNIPKPKTTMVYYIKYSDLINKIPELTNAYENPKSETIYNGEQSYKILDWVFKETPWHLEGVEEKKIEGFKQKLNIRSAFTSDDDKYWVSCDFSAQELRVPALLTKEPGWCKVFENNGDLHEHMAKVIWGEKEYNKQKRKRAKKCNFGILYGMTAKNFAIDFEISMEEAQKIVDDYKKGAPVLFDWVHRNEILTRQRGVTQTMFGRPRRLGWYLSDQRSWGMQNFGIRSCTNTVIQGTGADILKMSFLNIYHKFYDTPEKRESSRKFIKFLNTVHDEINYNVSKQHVRTIVPMIIKCMRLWFDDWDFPMQVGLEIGTRWGRTIAFDYDTNPYIIPTSYQPNIKRYRKLSDEEASKYNLHGLKKYIEDPNGEYIVNENYLHILEPAGEPVTEEDYIVKEDSKEIIEEHIEVDQLNDFDEYSDIAYSYNAFGSEEERDHYMSNSNIRRK